MIATAAEELSGYSDSGADEPEQHQNVSSDREAEPNKSSPVVLKSFAAMSNVKAGRSAPPSPVSASRKWEMSDSATGNSR